MIRRRRGRLQGGAAACRASAAQGDRNDTRVRQYAAYEDFNGWTAAVADEYKGKSWDLLNDRSTYIAKDLDDRPYESSFDALGRTFPHPLGDGSSKYFYIVLYVTPMADELSLDFAKTLIEKEKVGQGDETDYLAISFSSPDVAGHLFGASSLEYEDAVLRVDALLSQLFRYVDEKVGLDDTLIVLSADHGGTEAPEYLQSLGKEAGRYHTAGALGIVAK